jgi:hypothetical protein
MPPALPQPPVVVPEPARGSTPSTSAPPANPRPLPLSPRPPSPDGSVDELRAALRRFFTSDFDGAARTLEPLASRSAPARLVLSYALASSWLASARRDHTLLERAVREHEAALRAGAAEEDLYVSPAVRRLLARSAR